MGCHRYQEISSHLERKILDGSLSGRLPGIIRMTRDFKASQATIRHALDILLEKGLLTVNGTHGTFVTGIRPEKEHYGVIGLVGKVLDVRRNALLLEELDAFAAPKGFSMLQITNLSELIRTRSQVIAALPCDGFLVFGLTSELAVAIRTKGKGLVSLNACYGIPGVPWVDFDWHCAIPKLLRMLCAKGHSRIGLAAWNNRNYGFRDRLFEIYHKAMEENGIFEPDYFYAKMDAASLFAKHGSRINKVAGSMIADYFIGLDNPVSALYMQLEHPVAHAFAEAWKKRAGKRKVPLVIVCDHCPDIKDKMLWMDYADLHKKGIGMLVDQLSGNNSIQKQAYSHVTIKGF